MNRRIIAGVVMLAGALVVAVPQALGELITWEFAGEVTSVFDTNDVFGGAIVVGSPFSGSFTFESTTPDSVPGYPTWGVYNDAVTALSGTVGDVPFAANALGGISVANDSEPLPPYDEYYDKYTLWANVDFVGDTTRAGFQLRDQTATIFSTDELPLNPPPLDGLTWNDFLIANQVEEIFIRGELTTLIIPEPGSAGLLAIGGLVLAWARRRKRNVAMLRAKPRPVVLVFVIGFSVAGFTHQARAQEVCGCMDMVLVIDVTASMDDSRPALRQDLALIIQNTALPASGGDLRVGMITFAENVTVRHTLTTDINAVLATLDTRHGVGYYRKRSNLVLQWGRS